MPRSLLMSLLAGLSTASIVNIGDKPMQPIAGRVCAIADMDKDGNTDLIMQQNNMLVVYLQATDGSEFRKSQTQITLSAAVGHVSCAVGDFNGDTCPDLLTFQEDLNIIDKIKAVFRAEDPHYEARYFVNDGNNTFTEHQICDENSASNDDQQQTTAAGPTNCPAKFVDHPTLLDINGDGVTDVLGFVYRDIGSASSGEGANNNGMALLCLEGHRTVPSKFEFRHCASKFPSIDGGVHAGFTPIFADLDKDLSAEIVFLEADKRKLVVWSQISAMSWKPNESLSAQLPALAEGEVLASPLVADVDSDGQVDILIPVCASSACTTISKMWCYARSAINTVQIDLRQATLEPEIDGQTNVLFRIGDFSQNGYPDLIATVVNGGTKAPMIFDNVPNDGSNFSRKFELSKSAQHILPPLNEKLSGLTMSAFFDLKEDGNLDMMVEYYESDKGTYVNFVRCDEKGDTTFLKVQVFTSIECTGACCELTPKDSVRSIKIGSGIVWHGACVSIQMTDSEQPDGFRHTALCQLPQTSHRLLHNPFVLFGLSRSPNFVDEVHFGGPRLASTGRFQQDLIRQVVPNSRVVVIPPDEEGAHWVSRLFVTPSQLIKLSLVVMATCCGLLLLLIAFLHFRERQQDKKERQAQTHRFHFDAM